MGGLADYVLMGEPTEIQAAGTDRAEEVRSTAALTDRNEDGTPATRAPRAVLARVGERLRYPGRPRVWFELALIAVSYWFYSLVRNAVPEQEADAQHHARQIWSLEQHLGITVERRINHAVDSVTWLITGMDYYYATLHFIVTIGVMVWVFRWHPGRYTAVRSSLFATTAIALVGFYFYPLAPPRLMAHGNFIDTVAVHRTWGSMASGDMAHVSNQYAAMPSMHIGWSLWCGLTLAYLARRRWVKAVGLLYPVATLVVIVSTGNHFLMDAVGGAVCLMVGFTTSRLVHRRWAYRFPQLPERERLVAAGPRAFGGAAAVAAVPGQGSGQDCGPGQDPRSGPSKVSAGSR
jgi:hypothetical protein